MKFKISLLALILYALTVSATGEGYQRVSMPSFFSYQALRNKNALDAEAGKVWIGFRDIGILAWDGNTWINYEPNIGCPDLNVTAIDLLNTGEAWVGCDTGGIGYFDGFGWTTFNYWNSPVSAGRILTIRVSGSNVWAGTYNGILRYDGSSWTLFNTANSSLPSDTVYQIVPDNNGGIYAGTQQGLIRFDGNNWSEFWNPGPAVTEININNNGSLFAIAGSALFVRSGSIWQPFTATHSTTGYDTQPVKGLCVNVSGNPVAIGSFSQLTEFSPQIPMVYYMDAIFSGGQPNSITDIDDSNGNLWFINLLSTGNFLNDLFLFSPSTYISIGKGLTPYNFRVLDENKVDAAILNRGDMHWDLFASSYIAPDDQSASPIFMSSIWLSALDSSGTIRLAAQRYRVQGNNDFFPGPLDPVTGATDSMIATRFDRIWSVTAYDISEFQWQFAQGNVQNGSWVVPPDIKDWPGRGNYGVTDDCAPFVDVNNNGIYDPVSGGDYPLIEGDQEMFWIFNDNLDLHEESGGLPLGVQVNTRARSFRCDNLTDSTDLINYITVYDFDVINRSGRDYSDFVFSMSQDVDLGTYTDDYVGCDTMNNCGFVYNGDSYDDPSFYPSYGNFPPMLASVFLEGPPAPTADGKDNDHDGSTDEPGEEVLLSGFVSYFTGNTALAYGTPLTSVDLYRFQRSVWKDSSHVTLGGNGYGGSTPINYMFPGIPWDTTQWNEASGGQISGDRFMMSNCGPAVLSAGDTLHYRIAMLFLTDSSSAYGTPAYFDQIRRGCSMTKTWNENNSWPSCPVLYDNIQEFSSSLDFQVYPVPADETIFFQYPNDLNDAYLEVHDIKGSALFRSQATLPGSLNISNWSPGVYFITLFDGSRTSTKKFIVY